jgi:hypothetical protein
MSGPISLCVIEWTRLCLHYVFCARVVVSAVTEIKGKKQTAPGFFLSGTARDWETHDARAHLALRYIFIQRYTCPIHGPIVSSHGIQMSQIPYIMFRSNDIRKSVSFFKAIQAFFF